MEIEFRGPGSMNSDWAVFIYADTCSLMRKDQWDYLVGEKGRWGPKWFMIGDFNDILSMEEKRGGRVRNEKSFDDFKEFVRAMGMSEIPYSGNTFTWSNLRIGVECVEERLDRSFGSPGWRLDWPKAIVSHIMRISSDHHMLILDTEPACQKSKKRFYFDKRWVETEGVEEVVKKAWGLPQEGTPLFQIQNRIRACRLGLLTWSKKVVTNSAKIIRDNTEKLEALSHLGSQKDHEVWLSLKKDLHKAYENEETYWRQKSRVQWLREGDKNTKFFHASTVQRHKWNAIDWLICEDGTVCESKEDKVEEIKEGRWDRSSTKAKQQKDMNRFQCWSCFCGVECRRVTGVEELVVTARTGEGMTERMNRQDIIISSSDEVTR
ncbi:hypothetical protein DH2020_020458 [Rehmannia glutinosa]|uniref:Endonuclease/exonuclease/phosphatase domain-containing protein n=1 Tax=Rehmannia glutinosa TaxID=99300 RepID=A0ABR0WHN6_REHGL